MTEIEVLITILGTANIVFGLSSLFARRPDYPLAMMNFISAAACFYIALT